MNTRLFIGFLVLGAAGLAQAQIVPTGPFAGSLFDDFESYPTYSSGGNYSTLPVMGGGATFNASTAQLYIYNTTTDTWGLGGYGQASVWSPNQGLSLYDLGNPITVTLNFTTPVSQFGGYFATDSNANGDLTLDFYDVNNSLLGSTVFDSGSNQMQWQGWASLGNAISYIKFGNNIAPAMDDIRANPVPEPATMAALGLGVVALMRRRRKS